jgi:hypothetical protein
LGEFSSFGFVDFPSTSSAVEAFWNQRSVSYCENCAISDCIIRLWSLKTTSWLHDLIL